MPALVEWTLSQPAAQEGKPTAEGLCCTPLQIGVQLSLLGPYLGWWAVKKTVATEFNVTKYVVLTGAQVRLPRQPFPAAETCPSSGLSTRKCSWFLVRKDGLLRRHQGLHDFLANSPLEHGGCAHVSWPHERFAQCLTSPSAFYRWLAACMAQSWSTLKARRLHQFPPLTPMSPAQRWVIFIR